VDAYSKFPIVKILNDITSHSTIKFCRESFATFGIPEVFVSDNGTQLCSKEFSDFLKSNGIKHKQTAPFNPATNGQAERFVQILKNALISLHPTSHDLELNLQKLLLHYRITPHCSTNTE
jgi:transposase InsO family protein